MKCLQSYYAILTNENNEFDNDIIINDHDQFIFISFFDDYTNHDIIFHNYYLYNYYNIVYKNKEVIDILFNL